VPTGCWAAFVDGPAGSSGASGRGCGQDQADGSAGRRGEAEMRSVLVLEKLAERGAGRARRCGCPRWPPGARRTPRASWRAWRRWARAPARAPRRGGPARELRQAVREGGGAHPDCAERYAAMANVARRAMDPSRLGVRAQPGRGARPGLE
jgi:hypothetical protein